MATPGFNMGAGDQFVQQTLYPIAHLQPPNVLSNCLLRPFFPGPSGGQATALVPTPGPLPP